MAGSMSIDPGYASESKGPETVSLCIFFMVMAFVVLCLRLFSRLWVVRAMGLDDGRFQCFTQVQRQNLLTKFLHAVLICFAVVGPDQEKRSPTTLLTK